MLQILISGSNLLVRSLSQMQVVNEDGESYVQPCEKKLSVTGDSIFIDYFIYITTELDC